VNKKKERNYVTSLRQQEELLGFLTALTTTTILSFTTIGNSLWKKMRGKSIPRSVLKSGVKLPELSKSKSMSIPCDLNKANFVISSRGPTPQEELDACRPLLSLSDNLFIKKDRRKPSPVTKRQIEVEIRCEEKQVVDGSNKNNGGPDFRERVRQELSAVLKKSPDFNVVSPRQLLMQEQIENRNANRRQESPATRRIVSFSGTVHVEERDSTSEDEEIENDGKHDEADSKRTEKWQGTTAKSQNVAVSQSNSATNKENENVGTVAEGDACQRCGSQVYSMEKLEPGPGQFYHDRCFRCAVCKTKLSLATFCRSLQATNDPRVYCRPHQPRLDKVNPQVRSGGGG
jgi:hypothetical protein